jgi:hypothetical protein
MPMRSQSGFALTAIMALALWLSASSSGYAQRAGPFTRLAGDWSGAGTIDLSDGRRERIRCRAAYNAPSQRNLGLNIRCASESYNFDLHGSITLASSTVTGTWSESTRNMTGEVSGRASGDHIYVLATSPSFSATMSLVTHGRRQSVVIRSRDPNSSIKGVSISLRR